MKVRKRKDLTKLENISAPRQWGPGHYLIGMRVTVPSTTQHRKQIGNHSWLTCTGRSSERGLPMRALQCVTVSALLVAAGCAVGGCKPSTSAEAKASRGAAEAPATKSLIGAWKSVPGDRAKNDVGLAMVFERNGTMQMTAEAALGRRSGYTWHCQGRYEFDGGTLKRDFSSCNSCPMGGSCVELPLAKIPGGAKADFPVSFLTPNSVMIGTAVLFADKRQ